MEKYKDFLSDFDESYIEFQTQICEKNYSEAASIQGYLLGMLRAAQLLCDIETDTCFKSEIIKRADFLSRNSGGKEDEMQ